jgi:hypothetical protein
MAREPVAESDPDLEAESVSGTGQGWELEAAAGLVVEFTVLAAGFLHQQRSQRPIRTIQKKRVGLKSRVLVCSG